MEEDKFKTLSNSDNFIDLTMEDNLVLGIPNTFIGNKKAKSPKLLSNNRNQNFTISPPISDDDIVEVIGMYQPLSNKSSKLVNKNISKNQVIIIDSSTLPDITYTPFPTLSLEISPLQYPAPTFNPFLPSKISNSNITSTENNVKFEQTSNDFIQNDASFHSIGVDFENIYSKENFNSKLTSSQLHHRSEELLDTKHYFYQVSEIEKSNLIFHDLERNSNSREADESEVITQPGYLGNCDDRESNHRSFNDYIFPGDSYIDVSEEILISKNLNFKDDMVDFNENILLQSEIKSETMEQLDQRTQLKRLRNVSDCEDENEKIKMRKEKWNSPNNFLIQSSEEHVENYIEEKSNNSFEVVVPQYIDQTTQEIHINSELQKNNQIKSYNLSTKESQNDLTRNARDFRKNCLNPNLKWKKHDIQESSLNSDNRLATLSCKSSLFTLYRQLETGELSIARKPTFQPYAPLQIYDPLVTPDTRLPTYIPRKKGLTKKELALLKVHIREIDGCINDQLAAPTGIAKYVSQKNIESLKFAAYSKTGSGQATEIKICGTCPKIVREGSRDKEKVIMTLVASFTSEVGDYNENGNLVLMDLFREVRDNKKNTFNSLELKGHRVEVQTENQTRVETRSVLDVCFSNDGCEIYSGGSDGKVSRWLYKEGFQIENALK
ncbi:hypothetical protein HK096_003092, partial [Nowakowskiella sp. JEL0078]